MVTPTRVRMTWHGTWVESTGRTELREANGNAHRLAVRVQGGRVVGAGIDSRGRFKIGGKVRGNRVAFAKVYDGQSVRIIHRGTIEFGATITGAFDVAPGRRGRFILCGLPAAEAEARM